MVDSPTFYIHVKTSFYFLSDLSRRNFLWVGTLHRLDDPTQFQSVGHLWPDCISSVEKSENLFDIVTENFEIVTLALPKQCLAWLLFPSKNSKIFLFTHQVEFIAVLRCDRLLLIRCELIKCVFLFLRFMVNKASKKSRALHQLHSPEQYVKEWFLSTVKGNHFISHSGYFRCLWEVWIRNSEQFNSGKCFSRVLNTHLPRFVQASVCCNSALQYLAVSKTSFF